MSDSTLAALLQQEVATLREINLKQQAQIEALTAQLEALKQDNVILRLKVDAMARKLFGRSSEKLDPAQLQLVFDALQDPDGVKKLAASDSDAGASEAEEPASTKPSQGKRKKRSLDELIEGLPVTEVLIDPEEVKDAPAAWDCIGAETTKLIDYTPGHFHCQKLVRRKFVRKEARHLPPITAPLRTLQDRCIATPRLLAHTLTQRFEQHLPFYRIEASYARQGMPIPRQTLFAWAGMTHPFGLILADIKAEVFADGYVQVDETPVKYQDPKRQGSCGTGYLWVVHNPVRNLSYFEWHTGRSAACLDHIIPTGWTGIIQCDNYAAYLAWVKRRTDPGGVILAGCLAHVRRKFFEAQPEGEDARWVLAQIQQLYRIEARLRDARAGPMERRQTRLQDSVAILQRIKDRLGRLQSSAKHRPTSLTGEAIRYALNQWQKLLVFVNDGRVEIDNNLVENTIRPSAIGKKNWLFMGDAATGERAATFYTLIGNCHREGIDATTYLTDVLTRLPSETNQTVHRLTPKAWAEQRRQAKTAKLAATP